MITAAGILFFGALAANQGLQSAGEKALQELSAQGFSVPSAADPIRVYPAMNLGSFYSKHAGLWRPGVIYLREKPTSDFNASTYLRHELMHEASFRTCYGRLKKWEEEAHAMVFSGETAKQMDGDTGAFDANLFAEHLKYDRNLSELDYKHLRRILVTENIKLKPCEKVQFRSLDVTTRDTAESLVMHLYSGRIYDAYGDIHRSEPLGSLLKVALAASLADPVVDQTALQQALLASDTTKMSDFCGAIDAHRWFAITKDSSSDCPTMLGLPDSKGQFRIKRSLVEAAMMMRSSFLSRFDVLKSLQRNGTDKQSTLFKLGYELKIALQGYKVASKTGTVSNSAGLPLVGYTAFVWPADHPTFLAIVRRRGVVGYVAAQSQSQILLAWLKSLDVAHANATVKIMSRLARPMWNAQSSCELMSTRGLPGDYLFSPCAEIQINTTAPKAKEHRLLHGLISKNENGPVSYTTDAVTYSEGVLEAEFSEARGSAADALEAVINFNATHAKSRHGSLAHVCDTTHCMVYRGDAEQNLKPVTMQRYMKMQELIVGLENRAERFESKWLSFSLGGNEPWITKVSMDAVVRALKVAMITDLRRVRKRNGDIVVTYMYPEGEGTIACEVFRNSLKLRSCPEEIREIHKDRYFEFSGHGEGHGVGLDLMTALAAARAGKSAESILRAAF